VIFLDIDMKNVSILNFKMNNFAGKWDLISLIL